MKRQRSLADFCHGSFETAAQKRSREDRSTSSGASVDSSSSTVPSSDHEPIIPDSSDDDITVSFLRAIELRSCVSFGIFVLNRNTLCTVQDKPQII